MTSVVTTFHPLDRERAADPFDALATLQSTCPVARIDRERFDPITLITSYQAVTDVYQGRYQFSNRFGHSLAADPGATFDTSTLFSLDGDAHRRVRRALVAALNPHLVDAASPYITDLGAAVVSEIPDTGRADLRTAWATRIPGKVVAHLIGVPEEDHEQFFGWTMAKMATLARMTQGLATVDEVRQVDAPFNRYLQGLLDERRSAAGNGGRDDILSRLLAIEDDDGGHLADREILGNAVFLLNAGNQTTQNLLMNLVHQLITTDQWSAVRDDRSLVPMAVEESLRLTPPIQYGVRRPTEDTTIGGCPVAAGEVLVLSHLAANRDPSVWGEDAARFNLDRTMDVKHLGFGMGPHSCVGSAVARKVAVIAMNALLDRFSSLRLAPGWKWERQDYWTSMGMTSLEVVWP